MSPIASSASGREAHRLCLFAGVRMGQTLRDGDGFVDLADCYEFSDYSWQSGGDRRLAAGLSDLDLQPDLNDLCRRYAEIGRREIGVEVHRCKQPLTPNRQPRHFAAGDHHHAAKIIGDLLGIDAG